MRVLLVTPLFFPSVSGAAVYFDTLGRELLRLLPGGEVTVLTRGVPGAPRRERRDGLGVLRLLPAGDGRAGALLTGLTMLAASRALRCDVVHYHTLASYRVLRRLAPLFRAPLIGDMRDLAARDEGASITAYGHCSRLICASENILGFLRAAGFPPDRLVPVPVPLAPPARAAPEQVAETARRWGLAGAPYALFAGALTPGKGVPELLAAMPAVWRRRPTLHLALAGPAPSGRTRHRASGAAGVDGLTGAVAGDPRLHRLGPVPHPDLLRLLQGAELFVLPSRSEGLPRSALEALALGVPVVLPPGIPEFDAACPEAVLPALTPESIAEAMLAAPARGPARYPLHRHDPTAVAARVIEIYRTVTRAPAGGRAPARVR
jgi:glycosyltransferase involved in cell wall biosynthesis